MLNVTKLTRTAQRRSELNIIKTNGFTKGFLEPGDRFFFVIKPTHKSGEKYSALERRIDYIYTRGPDSPCGRPYQATARGPA